jgi:hypothetical protein
MKLDKHLITLENSPNEISQMSGRQQTSDRELLSLLTRGSIPLATPFFVTSRNRLPATAILRRLAVRLQLSQIGFYGGSSGIGPANDLTANENSWFVWHFKKDSLETTERGAVSPSLYAAHADLKLHQIC